MNTIRTHSRRWNDAREADVGLDLVFDDAEVTADLSDKQALDLAISLFDVADLDNLDADDRKEVLLRYAEHQLL